MYASFPGGGTDLSVMGFTDSSKLIVYSYLQLFEVLYLSCFAKLVNLSSACKRRGGN